MHLLSLSILLMLKMLLMVVMAMTFMDIVFGSNLRMVGEDRHLQLIDIAATVAGVVAVESLGALIIVLWSQDYLLLLHGKI